MSEDTETIQKWGFYVEVLEVQVLLEPLEEQLDHQTDTPTINRAILSPYISEFVQHSPP